MRLKRGLIGLMGLIAKGHFLPYGVRLLVLAAKVSGIGVLWVRDGATD